MDISTRTIRLPASDGSEVEAFVAKPRAPGPWPAIVFGGEAMGPNRFNRRIATDAAALGYVTIVPDYYRGQGPAHPDDYDDFAEVIAAIDALDFCNATFDLIAAADWLSAHPAVDARRIATWGYCTGGTLSMLAASIDRRFAAAVLYFPSQPVFPELTDRRPVHPMDLIWALRCPVMLIYGDQDPIMPPDLLAEFRRRLASRDVGYDVRIYAGAGHAFSAPAPHMHDAGATSASWAAAIDFLATEMSGDKG